jgi:hypothetical protein
LIFKSKYNPLDCTRIHSPCKFLLNKFIFSLRYRRKDPIRALFRFYG